MKHKRERYQKQASMLSKLTRQLSIHDNRASAASNWSDDSSGAGNVECTKITIVNLIISEQFINN